VQPCKLAASQDGLSSAQSLANATETESEIRLAQDTKQLQMVLSDQQSNYTFLK
jgi:hypothetical protein